MKGTENTGAGMIACQDKWHPSTLAEFHIHPRLESSHAYTGREGREVIAALVCSGVLCACKLPASLYDFPVLIFQGRLV